MSQSNSDEIVEVDGSYGEGGGQIIRNAVTYACLLRKNIHLKNIRANRPNPGLASQHLESILGLLQISGGNTPTALRKGLTDFILNGTPIAKDIQGVKTIIDLKTAGSVTLCMQCVLPFLLSLKSPSKIRIIGGTHTMKAPNYDYIERVFLPVFTKFMRYDVSAELIRPGYFPRGGGCVELTVNPSSTFNPFELTERGKLIDLHAILNLTPRLLNHTQEFKNRIAQDTRSIEVRNVSYVSAEYFLRFDSGYAAGFHYLADGRNPRYEQVIEAITKVQNDFQEFMNSPGAAVDSFMQDQLIIYMTLAKLANPSNVSRFRTVSLTDHTLSAIHVAQLMSSNTCQFNYEKENSSSPKDVTHQVSL